MTAAPNMACKVIDWVVQAYGGAGTNNDVGVASAYATARLLLHTIFKEVLGREVTHAEMAQGYAVFLQKN